MRNDAHFGHISFDLDGTLLDTVGVMRMAWQATMDEFHLTNDFSEYKREVGLPFRKIMAALGIFDDDGEIERFYFSQTEAHAYEAKLFPGAMGFLERIKKEGISTSIITSKPRKNTQSLLKIFDVSVDVVVCGDDSIGAKPDAAPMDFVRSQLQIDRGEPVLYYGDMLSDIVYCVNSGIQYCHCDFGIYGSLPDLLVPRPSFITAWDKKALKVAGLH
jgi:phosphoglycolate phosphatase-like HAD superfamily hydrolase